MKTIGNRIAAWRKEKGLTQEELAEALGVSAQAVSKWENDVSCPDISLLPKLAKILEVTTDELLTGRSQNVKLVPAAQRKSLEELTLRIRVNSAEGDKVRVNLPLSLVKVAVEMGMEIAPNFADGKLDALKNLDIRQIIDLAQRGVIGKLIEAESAEGDIVEVVVE